MADEIKEEVPEVVVEEVKVETVPEKSFKDFIDSKEYIDHMNGLKGQWKEQLEKTKTETAEQTAIRELTEWKANAIKEQTLAMKQSELRAKAKEIGYDVLRADRYAVYGDEAINQMIADSEYQKSLIDEAIEKKIKGSFESPVPKISTEGGQKLTIDQTKGMSRDEISALISKGMIEGL